MTTQGRGAKSIHSDWSGGELYFYEKSVGRTTTGDLLKIGTSEIDVGNSGQDVDLKVFMGSASDYILFDVGNKSLALVGLAKVDIGSSGTPLVLTAGTPIVDIYSTCASTSGSTSAQPFYLKSTMTGAGGVGGRAHFHLYSNVALGGWANAIKASTEFGASGRITGLASGICSEVTLSAGCTQGTYTCFEGEMVLGTGAVTGTSTSFMYFNVSGAAAATFDTNGVLFELGTGFTSGSGKFWYDNTANAADEFIKVRTESGVRYLALSDDTSWA